MPIDSRDSLCRHLQTAIELEHSTLPPYLCALYSMADGTNAEARDVLQSVAIEEMLHLTLAANILNAIGGQPVLDAPQLLPPHPTSLPHSNGSTTPIEQHQEPAIHPFVDGPYRVRGGIEVIGADGQAYEVRERQALCRCGQSRNKPFSDGSLWYAGFRDPLPPELVGVGPPPWAEPGAADRGRARYAREQAELAAAKKER